MLFYSQPDISDVSSSRKRSLRLVETAEIQVKRCSPLYFEPMPNLSKTLEGLLTPHVIFVNTIFQLNSLNITVSVCYMSGSKVNRKERRAVRLCLFVFVFHLAKYINLGAFGSADSVSCLESEKGRGTVWISHDHRNHNRHSHKSCSSFIGLLFYSVELRIVFFL